MARALRRVVILSGRSAAWLILAVMMVILLDVTFRGIGPLTSIRLQEAAWHFNGALFLTVLGWAYLADTHVRIELFSAKFSAVQAAWVELLGCALFLAPYTAVVGFFAFDYAAIAYTFGETSASPSGLPARWIIKSVLVAGFAILGMAAVVRLLEAGLYLFGPTELRPKLGFDHPPHTSGAA